MAILGVLKAGGAYVPLDPGLSRESVAVHDPGRGRPTPADPGEPARSGGGSGVPLVSLDGEPGAFAAEEGTNLDDGAAPGNLAYVIYTSGSTGRPKGVAIEHRSAVDVRALGGPVFAPEELAGVLAVDVRLLRSLHLRAVRPPEPAAAGGARRRTPSTLPGLDAGGEHVTLVNTVPSVMTELPRTRGPAGLGAHGQPRGRAAVPASSSIGSTRSRASSRSTTSTARRRPRPTRPADRVRRAGESPPTIGRPIANTRAYVLDARGASRCRSASPASSSSAATAWRAAISAGPS